MIGYLHGTALDNEDDTITLCVGGIGYEVHVPDRLDSAAYDQRNVWIHEHAPQDAPHELYGFREREERDLFRRLLNIKGVGPKVAMRIVASGSIATLTTNDGYATKLHELTKIRGVGATLANRICEEMA